MAIFLGKYKQRHACSGSFGKGIENCIHIFATISGVEAEGFRLRGGESGKSETGRGNLMVPRRRLKGHAPADINCKKIYCVNL